MGLFDVYTLKCIQFLHTQSDIHIHTKATYLEAGALVKIQVFIGTCSAHQCWISYIKQKILISNNNIHTENATLKSLPILSTHKELGEVRLCTGWGKSRFILVHIENNTIINK